MSPLVSVIIPVYNTATYLRRCLESVCNQTLENIEIICINDGSTDNSLDILEDFAKKDTRIRIITTDNHGLGAARNVGLENSKGVWITGVDSDDYLEIDTFSYVINNATEDVDIIQFGFNAKQEGEEGSFSKCKLNGLHVVSPHVLIEHPSYFWGKFWKKSFIDKHCCRFPEGVWYEDWFFYWAYLPLSSKIMYLSECKYVYTQRNDSIMGESNKKNERIMEHIQVLELLLKYRSSASRSASFSILNLLNFIQCVRFVEKRIPDKCSTRAHVMLKELSLQSQLKPYKKWLRCNSDVSSILRLFTQQAYGLKRYGFLYWFPLSVGIEKDYIIWRLFGKRFWKYAVKATHA